MKSLVLASLLAAVEEGNGLGRGGLVPGTAFVDRPNFLKYSCRQRSQQRHICSERRIVARYSNNDFESENDSSNSMGENENDFPSYVKALTGWDISEQSSSSSANGVPNQGVSFDSFTFPIGNSNKISKIWGDEMSPLVAEMVNVEALTANRTGEEMDLLLPTFGDLIKSILDAKTKNLNGKLIGKKKSSKKTFPFLDNALKWDEFLALLQKNVQELTGLIADDMGLNVTVEELVKYEHSSPSNTALATEKIFQDATQRLEFLINGTSYAFSPSALASNALTIQEASDNLTAAAYNIFEQAGKAPRATAQYTAELVELTNGVLADGYEPLFNNYPSVRSIPSQEKRQKILKAGMFASLSGAIYESTLSRTHRLGHSIIAEGKTADIGWMVTDSVQYERDFRIHSEREDQTLVRTFVIRGFDASDEEVNRERLLNIICTASPVPLFKNELVSIQVHEGMLSMAQELFRELETYIDLTCPSHKFVFTGHSVGGSLAILLMILLANDRGASFVKDRVLRVFTFGSPPIFALRSTSNVNQYGFDSDSCSILDAFDLPTDLVYAYCQPWDPIVRLFSKYDPLYPLIDDLGEDGCTPWVSGPSRTLRPILKTILESWEGWPAFRDNARVKLGQNYRGVGQQYLLLPEPIRYLTDRLVAVKTAVPPIDSVVQISSCDLLPALNEIFTLDTFTISYVSVAIRSFVHHFYPAYGSPVLDYAYKITEGEENSV